MRARTAILAAAVLGGLLASQAPAIAAAPPGGRPLVCAAGIEQSRAISSKTDRVEIGRLREFCNAPEGYEVWVDYPPELANSVMVVGADRLVLNRSGVIRVSSTPGPAMVDKPMSIENAPPGARFIFTARMLPNQGR